VRFPFERTLSLSTADLLLLLLLLLLLPSSGMVNTCSKFTAQRKVESSRLMSLALGLSVAHTKLVVNTLGSCTHLCASARRSQ